MISSLHLVRAGIPCTVIEKKSYPFHRVCGEYVSNEALPFLESSGLFPHELSLPRIRIFEMSSVGGKTCRVPLDLGGFGISRFSFDHFLYQRAKGEGVHFLLNTEATGVRFDGQKFRIDLSSGALEADVVIGSFGKRSRIDLQQNRKFVRRRSPYVGIKYHARTSHPGDVVSLHNFPGGYCGICNVEGGVTNVCYLVHRDYLRHAGAIGNLERTVLFRNPIIRDLFSNATFLFEKPEVINEVSFETKGAVGNHILMTGDAAGMIAPLCGNGMAMAIHSANLLSEIIVSFCRDEIDRYTMERSYQKCWNDTFRFRLWFGRNTQRMFGHPGSSALAVYMMSHAPPLARFFVTRSHGQPF